MFDIFPKTAVFRFVPDDTIIKPLLPNGFPKGLRRNAFELIDDCGYGRIRALRVKRQQEMHMVWHNAIPGDLHGRIMIGNQMNDLFNQLAGFIQYHDRFRPVPYVPENTSFILGTNGNHISPALGIVVVFQTVPFSDGYREVHCVASKAG